jgi:predicted AAA+ superfamily ATPase
MIPAHYLEEEYKKLLQAYVQDYLKEEVFEEGLTRNIPAFSRFFDAVGYTHGELVNYSNIARDCGVDAKTVREYFQILADTLLGNFILPFNKKHGRDLILKTPKFYLFDVGVAGWITQRQILEERGEEFARAFEHFILMEIIAYRSYKDLNFDIYFWRTKSGLEVDFILGKAEVAIEVKGTSRVDGRDLKGLFSFSEDYAPKKSFLVCNESAASKDKNIPIIPWREFLSALWAGEIIK